tara:strand:+ start:823 stop:1485 length:663 start_codon:yes stop_codon:yes gene_type:complete
MKVFVPTSWSEITVGEYQQLTSLDTEETPSQRLANIISITCDVNAFDIDLESKTEIEKCLSFMNKELSEDRLESFKHDGIEYEWVKSLNEITLGEQISIEQTIENEELNYYKSFDLVMAVLLVEKGGKFNAKNIEKNRELYSTFPIDKVHAMLLFFLNGGKLYSKNSKVFLVVPKMKRMKSGVMKKKRLTRKLKEKALEVVLSGLLWLTGWLRMISLNMK